MYVEIGARSALTAVAVLGSLPFALAAQEGEVPDSLRALAGEEVEEVALRGVSRVDRDALRAGLATGESECATPVYAPFCWLSDADLFMDRRFFAPEAFLEDELRIQVFYWRRGFRYAGVDSRAGRSDGGVRVVFEVDEGPPTVVDSLSIVQTRAVLERERIMAAGLLREGEPLDLVRLDTAVVRLRRSLLEEGYGNATVRREVTLPDSLRARVRVVLETGPATTVQKIVVQGNEDVSDRTVRQLVGIEPGAPFRPGAVRAAQRRLYGSELFRRARVLVPPEERRDSAKVLVTEVQEAPFWGVDAGIGVSTTDFGQVKARLTRYHFLGGARRLDLQAAVGNLLASRLFGPSLFDAAVPEGVSDEVRDAFLDPTYRLSIDFSDEFFLGTDNDLAAAVFAHRRSVPGVVIDRGRGATLTVGREVARGLRVDAGYRFQVNEVEAGQLYFCANFGVCRLPTIRAIQGTQQLAPLVASVGFDRTDDPLFPSGGLRASVGGEWADRATLSDYRYTRIRGEAVGYVSLGPGTLSIRARAGRVEALEGTNEALGVATTTGPILHPRTRFYSGGARSVRGYAQDQLGPRILTVDPTDLVETDDPAACTSASLADGTCDPGFLESEEFRPLPLGGRTVVEASVEYRIPFGPALHGVVFVDAVGGRDIDIPSVSRGDVTPGFGVRYLTAAGPVRVDLGLRSPISRDLAVVTEVEDPDGTRRVVQLELLKRYESSSLLKRLQLQISIGGGL